MRRYLPLLMLAVLVAPGAQALLAEESEHTLLVGHEEGTFDAVSEALRSLGAEVELLSDAIDVLVVTGPESLTRDTIAAVSGVTYVETDAPVGVSGAQWNGAEWNGAEWNGAEWNGAQWNEAETLLTDANAVHQWGLPAVRAPEAWSLTGGLASSTAVCVIDSGVDATHPDLLGRVLPGYNAIDGGTDTTDPAGHGTHIAGIVAATRDNAFGVAGVADVDILPVKVLTSDGTGTESDLARGLVWCAQQGAEVAVMALSSDREGRTVQRAIAYAAQKDVVLVASAGNNGPCEGCVSYPASDPHVLAVTSIDPDGGLSSFSSSGAAADLAAPGRDIVSAFPDGNVRSGSGTSQAAAFVAGAAAVVRDDAPALDARSTSKTLREAAADAGPSGHDASYGHGIVDAERAVELARGGA